MKHYLCKAYSKLNGHIFAVVGIAVSGIPIYFKMDSTISLQIFLPIVVGFFFIISILFGALYWAANEIALPKIKKCLDSSKPYDEFSLLALLAPYKLFTFNTVLSVFLVSDGVEELIGGGKVLNIQQNGFLLIGVKLFEGKEKHKSSLVQNNSDALKNLVIKPMTEA